VGDSTKRASDPQLTGGEAALQVPDFKCASLLVVGDVMLDSYWHGKTSRISPEAPVPVVSVGREEARLGGAGNVPITLRFWEPVPACSVWLARMTQATDLTLC